MRKTFCSAAVAASLLTWLAGTSFAAEAPGKATISVAVPDVDKGAVSWGDDLAYTFEITNKGTADLLLHNPTALARLAEDLDDRAYVEPKRQTVAVFLTETWLPAIEHTIKPSTFESYRRNVRLHVSGRAIGRRRLQQLGPADLNALYALLLAGDDEHRPLSPRSVAYIATILHRALRDAVRWHAIVRNPADAADPPRPSGKPEMNSSQWAMRQASLISSTVAPGRA